AEAGVSARTFNNYFSSKAEAIVWRHTDRVHRVASLLRDRPAGEPLWEAVTAAVTAPFEAAQVPEPDWAAGVRLVLGEPVLQAEFVASSAAAERECALAVAERTGTDAEHDIHPLLVAGVITTAIRVAQQQWLRADPPVPLVSLLRTALAQL